MVNDLAIFIEAARSKVLMTIKRVCIVVRKSQVIDILKRTRFYEVADEIPYTPDWT